MNLRFAEAIQHANQERRRPGSELAPSNPPDRPQPNSQGGYSAEGEGKGPLFSAFGAAQQNSLASSANHHQFGMTNAWMQHGRCAADQLGIVGHDRLRGGKVGCADGVTFCRRRGERWHLTSRSSIGSLRQLPAEFTLLVTVAQLLGRVCAAAFLARPNTRLSKLARLRIAFCVRFRAAATALARQPRPIIRATAARLQGSKAL